MQQRLGKSKATNKSRREADEETMNELKEAFKLFDSKNTGEIDARELKAIMKAFGIEVKKQDIRDLYAEMGKDIKEGLNLSEFVGVMTSKMGPRDSKEEIFKVFKLFDEDGLNKISYKNLKKIAAEVGEKLSDEELREMLEEADRDGDGSLNFDEFYRIMRRRNDPLDDLDSDED
jgi:Ca2+-binding EF-hand superfamily protein